MANAIGMVEFTSVARGIYAADQMVKVAQVEIASSGTVCPGKYIVIVYGTVADVQDSVQTGESLAGEFWVDSIVIPNVSPLVFPAITGTTTPEEVQALGIIESFSLSTMIVAADATLKAADLQPLEIRLGTGLGGKSYFTFAGDVAAVQTGLDAGVEILEEKGLLVNAEVIPSLSKQLLSSLL